MNTNERAFKSGIWYVIGNVLVKFVGLITTPIFTRILTTKQVGDFSNFTAWVEVFSVVATLNLAGSIMVARFDYKDDLDDYIASNLVLGSIISFVIYIIALSFKSFFLELLGFEEYELHVLFIYMIVYPALQMFLINKRVHYQYKSTIIVSLISTFVSVFCSLLFSILLTNKIIGRVLGFYVPLILLNIVLYLLIIKRAKKISYKYWMYAVRISLPMVWHSLSGSLLGSSDRIMIRHFCGSEDTALYSISYYCGMMISVLWSAINNAWSTWAYEKMDEQRYSELKNASKPLILFIVIIVFILLVLAPEMLLIMGGKEYIRAVWVVPPVLISYVFQSVYSLYVNIEYYEKKQVFIAVGTSCAALTNIVLNFVFIPRFGYTVAAFTTLVGYIFLFLIHYFIVYRMKKTSWYDTKFNVGLLLFSMFMIPIAYILYRFNAMRYILIILFTFIILIISLWARKEIFEFIRHRNFELLRLKLKSIIFRGEK
ncbi:MAG: lipopolysaccharide biosynthesis protein [Lachnospiraceae bacterium]